MKALARQRATYDDLVNVQENMVAELIDRDLYASPRPAGPHADMSSVLGMLSGFPYRLGRGGADPFPATEPLCIGNAED
jgi:hypothetical protein